MRRAADAGLGVVYLVITLAVLVTALLVYDKAFTGFTTVDLRTDRVGNALQKGSDVKVRGVPVGTVESIEPTSSGAVVRLRLDPAKAEEIPVGTTARLLPKTLFGERYVALAATGAGGGSAGVAGHLSDGDTIVQDTSDEAVQLEQVFDSLLPLLTAVQPEKISATLSEIATALRGQGADLGDTLVQVERYLTKLNPEVPQLADDLEQLGEVARQYDAAVPDLLTALDDLTVTSTTVADQRKELSSLYATVASAGDTTRGFLVPNEDTIVLVSKAGRKALDAVAPYASTFPCTLKALRDFIPIMDKALGKGTEQPGLHATLTVVGGRGGYDPGRDKVRYGAGAAGCPYFPGRGEAPPGALGQPGGTPSLVTPADPAGAISGGTGEGADAITGEGLGRANSPAENQLIAELVAPGLGTDPSSFPRWGSLLLGPTLRGRTVEVS